MADCDPALHAGHDELRTVRDDELRTVRASVEQDCAIAPAGDDPRGRHGVGAAAGAPSSIREPRLLWPVRVHPSAIHADRVVVVSCCIASYSMPPVVAAIYYINMY